MLGRLEQTAERARTEQWPYEQFLEALLEAVVFARDASGAHQRIRHASFPARKTLQDFDWTYPACGRAPAGRLADALAPSELDDAVGPRRVAHQPVEHWAQKLRRGQTHVLVGLVRDQLHRRELGERIVASCLARARTSIAAPADAPAVNLGDHGLRRSPPAHEIGHRAKGGADPSSSGIGGTIVFETLLGRVVSVDPVSWTHQSTVGRGRLSYLSVGTAASDSSLFTGDSYKEANSCLEA